MDFSEFADIAVVDGHIHFPHPELMDGVVEVMQTARFHQANLVAVPDLQIINQNPALIHFKAHHPERVYICGALDYSQVLSDLASAPEILASQVATLKGIGFDGLKLIEGKPMVRKLLGIPFDSPVYAGLWSALENEAFPVVFHVGDPEEFWEADRCPDWARAQGWFYGDGSHPLKEELYAEIEAVLERHRGLRIVFAHFFFLSADLERAAAFLDDHAHVFFDLTPGVEMYINFASDLGAARDFFQRYQDRLIYGTDIGASALGSDPAEGLDRAESLGRAWVVRRFLETEETFAAPEGVGHGLGMDTAVFSGIALPSDVLEKIYHANFERAFGHVPSPLRRDAALVELERLAQAIDTLRGEPVDSPARRVARRL